MSTTYELERTIATLREVSDRWPDLVESRLKGTARKLPGGRREHGDDSQDEGVGFGSIPAPVHLDVLDTMAKIVMTADMLHEHVAQTVGHPRLDHATSAGDDPRRFIAYVVELLPEACEDDEDMLEAASEKAGLMKSWLLAKLGEVYDGQTLEAICPFCVGRTFRKPSGERTIRVRLVPSRIHDGETEFVIVCENPDGCHVMASECNMWVAGRPAWPWSQWEWLATRLLPVPERAQLAG